MKYLLMKNPSTRKHLESQVRVCFLLPEVLCVVFLGRSCFWISGRLVCTSFDALVHLLTAEPRLLHDWKNVIAIVFSAQLLQTCHTQALFSSCTPYLRPTSQPISQVVLATAQSDSRPVHLR